MEPFGDDNQNQRFVQNQRFIPPPEFGQSKDFSNYREESSETLPKSFWQKYKIRIIIICVVVISLSLGLGLGLGLPKSSDVEITMYSINGDEKIKITDVKNKEIIVKEQEIKKSPGTTITFSTKEKSFLIHFLNDSQTPRRDLYLTQIKKNKEILPINKHIRGDIRYPNDKVRATTVSNGEFLWKTNDILSAYQIDL